MRILQHCIYQTLPVHRDRFLEGMRFNMTSSQRCTCGGEAVAYCVRCHSWICEKCLKNHPFAIISGSFCPFCNSVADELYTIHVAILASPTLKQIVSSEAMICKNCVEKLKKEINGFGFWKSIFELIIAKKAGEFNHGFQDSEVKTSW